MDGTASEGTGHDPADQIHHRAKVRVAGSNPVFRSIVAGQNRFFSHRRELSVIRLSRRIEFPSVGCSFPLVRAVRVRSQQWYSSVNIA